MIPKQPVRDVSLLDLSPCGLMGTNEKTSLAFPERARYVERGSSKKLTKLVRVIQFEPDGAIPSWIGELRSVRTIKCGSGKVKLEPLAKLPHLRQLFLDHSGLDSLAGLEKLTTLETITFSGTPIAKDDDAIAAAIAAIPGAKRFLIPGIQTKRTAPPAPKKNLAKALRDDTLADESDLRGVNLEGETFEDLWVTHDFAKARLARTVWKRCDFDCSFSGADLTGAAFEDCYFASNHRGGNLANVKARGMQMIWCGGDPQLNGADLREATLYLESDAGLEITKANLENAVIASSFCSEREHRWEAKGSNLKGAQVTLDVTPGRRAEIQKKKSSRFKWKEDHLRDAKVDKRTTQIVYVPLDGTPPPALGEPGAIDPNGPAANVLGSLWAINASLWVLVADADVAASWRGSDEDNEDDDFHRALDVEEGPIAIGKGKGFIAQLGDSGGTPIWEIPKGIMLAHVNIDRRLESQLNLRVAQWPAPKKPTKLGTVKVTSGSLAVMLPYENGVFTPAQRKAGMKKVVTAEDSKVLVPLPNGEYVISTAPLGPVENYEDELGWYGHAMRIERK